MIGSAAGLATASPLPAASNSTTAHARPKPLPPLIPVSATQPSVLRLLVLTPLNLLALWASELEEVRIAAGVAVAASAVLLFGAQQSKQAGRSFI